MQKSCLSYPVEFVEDAFGESEVLAKTLASVGGSSPRVMIVADMNVVQRCEGLGARIGKYVKEHEINLVGSPVVLSAGEKIKADNLQSALTVVSALLENKLGCNDIVLAIGGGTLLDVAGYASSQVRGGVRIVRMPTTPAAMMDAAFAEYAAIDSANVKDALRVQSKPSAVIIDTSFAKGVLDGVWIGGYGEAVRIALAKDSSLMKKLVKFAPAYRARTQETLCEVAKLVYETRMKKGTSTLALWAALRLESMSGYKLPHGYAVPIGICLETGYAVECGYMKSSDRDLVVECIRAAGAIDCIAHSKHLLGNADSLLRGLDAWELANGDARVVVPAGIGKVVDEKQPNREVYRKVMHDLLSLSATDQNLVK